MLTFIFGLLIYTGLGRTSLRDIIKQNTKYMTSRPRQFEIENIYHIIKRGVDGRKIFLSNQDYSRFILGLEFFNDENSINLWKIVRGDNTGRGPQPRSEKKL